MNSIDYSLNFHEMVLSNFEYSYSQIASLAVTFIDEQTMSVVSYSCLVFWVYVDSCLECSPQFGTFQLSCQMRVANVEFEVAFLPIKFD